MSCGDKRISAGSDASWSTDELGRLRVGGYHDSFITEFSYSAARNVRITMQNPDGGTGLALTLSGLHELAVNGLLHTIIVGDVFVWKAAAVQGDEAWRLLFKDHLRPEDIKDAAARHATKTPDALLVYVTSSYGATIVALCDHLRIEAMPHAEPTES